MVVRSASGGAVDAPYCFVDAPYCFSVLWRAELGLWEIPEPTLNDRFRSCNFCSAQNAAAASDRSAPAPPGGKVCYVLKHMKVLGDYCDEPCRCAVAV
jgi:hypothetical protein